MASLVLVGSVEGLHHTGREPRPRPFHSLHQRQFPVKVATAMKLNQTKFLVAVIILTFAQTQRTSLNVTDAKGAGAVATKRRCHAALQLAARQAKAKMVAMAVLMSNFIEESKGNAG